MSLSLKPVSDRLLNAIDLYRKAMEQTPVNAADKPDPKPFLSGLTEVESAEFLSRIADGSNDRRSVTVDSDPPHHDPSGDDTTTLDSDPFKTPDNDSPGLPTKRPDEYQTAGFGDFELSERTASRMSAGNAADRLDDYDLLNEIGHGGMGVVYKARQKALNRIVALKMVLAGGRASKTQITRFKAEALAVAKLDHPNIVQVYDIGEHDGLPFFAMEFVDGGALDTLLKKQSLEPRDAARLIETVTRAMAYAHSKGVIHRDLKPANILLSGHTADSRISTKSGTGPSSLLSTVTPKVTDFGLAKQIDDDGDPVTRSGAVMGTPHYMAPEQAEGNTKNVTQLADVYSLGATLYELITGRPPFQGPSIVNILSQVRASDPVHPSRLQPGIPRDLETICLKAMQKEPAKRYESAEAMADDLKRFLEGQPILARPIGSVEQFVRWCRRKPAQAGLTVSTAVLALALLGGGVVYATDLQKKNSVIKKQNDDLEATNLALANEKSEVQKQAESNADKVRFLLRNTAQDLKTVGLNKQRENLVGFLMSDLKRIEGLPGENAGIDDRARLGVYLNLAEIYFENAVAAGTDREKQKEFLTKSEEDYRKAVTLAESMAAAKLKSDLANGLWALALARRGEFALQTGKTADAAVDFDKALRLRKAIVDSPQSQPGTRDYLFEADRISSLAESIRNHCDHPDTAKDPKKATDALREMVSLNELALKTVEADPKTTEEPTGAVMFRRRLGTAYAYAARKVKGDEAKAYLEKARVVREKVCADVPDSIQDRVALSETVGKLGDSALFNNDAKTAGTLYEAMLNHLGKAVSPVDTRRQWGMAYYRIATAQLLAGEKEKAVRTYRKSANVWEELTKETGLPREHWGLMVALARCREVDQALALTNEVVEKFKQQVDTPYNAACTYSICAGAIGDGLPDDKLTAEQLKKRMECLDNAWAKLAKSIELKRKINDIPTDPDLAYLRSRPEFAKKLAEAKLPAKK
jgi:serine/threonine protein kinase